MSSATSCEWPPGNSRLGLEGSELLLMSLCHPSRLSGESPFQGDNDMETLSNITAARWDFEEETFLEISRQAKDFIRQLLQKDPR